MTLSIGQCTSSQSIGLFLGCALLWICVSLGSPFTISLIEFYFIMIYIMIAVTIIGIAIFLIFELHFQTFCNLVVLVLHRRLDIPSPWTFSLNIGLHMLPSDSIMSHSLIVYYTGDFQALQLHVLAAFGAVD